MCICVLQYLFPWIANKICTLFCTETVPVRTVNRQCSSGLQAVADVAAAIRAGFYDIDKKDVCFMTLTFTIPAVNNDVLIVIYSLCTF